MRVRRMALRVVCVISVALAAVWLALRTIEGPIEEGFPYWLQTNVERAIVVFGSFAAILILVELACFLAARLQR